MSNLDELREKLAALEFKTVAHRGRANDDGKWVQMFGLNHLNLNEIMPVISQYLEQETLKARIDELNTVLQIQWADGLSGKEWKEALLRRRDELTANKSKEK